MPNLFARYLRETSSISGIRGRCASSGASHGIAGCGPARSRRRSVRALASLLLALLLLPWLASCGGGGGESSASSDPPDPPPDPPAPTTVVLTPPLASVTTSQAITYTASGTNTTDSNVTWSVDGVANGNATLGTISAGVYTPTAAATGEHTILATSIATPTASATATLWVTAYAGTFTWRNDLQRTGQNPQELALSPATVNATNFGKLFLCPVDGQIYAEPLYVANLAISGGVHNVVFVATENDSLYAFDADASPCVTYWSDLNGGATSLLPTGEVVVPAADANSTSIQPFIGITGTPVVDPTTNTIYVVTKSKNISALNPVYVQRLHAIDITTGIEEPGSPVVITPLAAGTGDGSSGGMVGLDALTENQGAGLLLLGHTVYVAFGSLSTIAPYHGWVVGYDKTTLAQVSAFSDTPNGSAGGIWLGGAGLSVDPDSGYIYAASGVGTFDANSGAKPNNDYGQSFLKLDPSQLSVVDYFAPCDATTLLSLGRDLTSIGILPLPDAAGSVAHPRLLLGGDEAGSLYVLDRSSLGHFNGGTCPDSAPVEEISLGASLSGTPAVWADSTGTIRVYAGANGAKLGAYPISNAVLAPTPASQSPDVFSDQAPSPAISSNAGNTGIVWALDSAGYSSNPPTPAVLHAYDAKNLASELYNSSQAGARDVPGVALNFTVPLVGNGKVYAGTETELDVYGFLP
ncbi:MAG: hypothetical protein WBE97_04590 [Candidatus Acidiferrales bacterium]